MRSTLALALLLGACGDATPSPPSPVAPPSTTAAPITAVNAATALPPPCIVSGSEPTLDSVSVSDRELDFCAEGDRVPKQPRVCFRVDLASGEYRTAPLRARPPTRQPERVTGSWASMDEHGVHLCSPDSPPDPDCRTLTPVGYDLGIASEIACNTDGTRFIACHTGGCESLEIRDGVDGKVVLSIRPWNTEMGSPASFRMGFFAGDLVLALIADTPVTSEGRLFDVRGKLLLKLGQVAEHAPHSLGNDRWAIETWEARQLVVLDAKRGRSATYSLRPTVPDAMDASNPLVATAAARADGGITVLFAHGLSGTVALFTSDPTVQPRVLHPPVCASTP
jgi:hypothetical protein